MCHGKENAWLLRFSVPSIMMVYKYNFNIIIWTIVSYYSTIVESRGLLILHRPIDATNDCMFSRKLRYDISFGVGKADTITLILRTIPDVDYECEIDISTDFMNKLIAVIHYPNILGINCDANPFGFHVMRKEECFAVCDMLEFKDKFSKEWIMFTKGRFRFQFRSNSNINTDMNAYFYSVTVTTARTRAVNGSCFSEMNETECYAPPPLNEHYCITSAVMCDGINNCGVSDWFDEKTTECDVPHNQLSYVSIFAVVSLFICSLIAGSHILLSCLPQASSFFVYNTNEDNRFCIDPMLTFPEPESRKERNSAILDNSNDTSLDDSDDDDDYIITDLYGMPVLRASSFSHAHDEVRQVEEKALSAKEKKRSVSERLQQRIRSIGWRHSSNLPAQKSTEEV